MKQKDENQHVKRTQKDYSYTFKLSVVEEIERGELGIRAASRKYGIQSHSTITNWLRKYGTFDWYNKTHLNLSKSPEQKLLELEQKVKLLEKQKASLEKKLEFTDKKAIFFDMMIDIAEEELKIPIRKKYSPEQSNDSKNSTKKA
ncbi:helix-turn-helix domain-containing protein [Mangrovivirga cuniculi]|uniref:helix-turn-helix domain-containing protein n=1 Tax=Mangrovivirga cuniculi TaxID=2715131 RepID=UPI001C30928D|nr:helix-turn-helix domain-containing protein [Mangrovivirga cuniculi]